MPLPMVHISITYQMFGSFSDEATQQFLLGCISPDAIHMRLNSVREDKKKTHFYLDDAESAHDLFHDKLVPFVDSFRGDKAQTWFAKGYAAHVLTDFIWLKTVYSAFKEKVERSDVNDPRTLYYQETDQIDFNLYKCEPWRTAAWEALEKTYSIDVPGLLAAAEVQKWKLRTLEWFDDGSKEPKVQPAYITEEAVRHFIDTTASEIIDLFNEKNYL
jgi:hypothetical protein